MLIGGMAALNFCLVLLVVFGQALAAYDSRQKAVGFGNIHKDTFNQTCILNSGSVPKWLKGYFLRQSCGAFGETGSTIPIINKVTHLFDCIPMATSFRINDGQVSFSNKFHQTATRDIWDNYNHNMNESRVWYSTTFSDIDVDRMALLSPNYTNSPKPGYVPHVTWWNINGKALGLSEHHGEVQVDLPTLNTVGYYQWLDDNFGYPYNAQFVDNPAHDHIDADGVHWSAMHVHLMNGSTAEVRTAVYSIKNDYRTVVGDYSWGYINLENCKGGPYPDTRVRPGYMHSFCMTDNYIVLPLTSYLFDACGMYANPAILPFFKAAFQWRGDVKSKLLVMRKSDGFVVKVIETEAFFTTHQLNSYEKDGKLHLDMLTYKNADIYTRHTYVENLVKEVIWETWVERFVIDMSSWTLLERKYLYKTQPDVLEFSTINYNQYNGKEYSFAYMVKRPYLSQGEIIKLNVDTGETKTYVAPSGFYPQEPVFVAAPNNKDEDEGVVLVQGLDANQDKGFLVILNARTMTEEARLTGTDAVLFGIHNLFFPYNFESQLVTSSAAIYYGELVLLILLFSFLGTVFC